MEIFLKDLTGQLPPPPPPLPQNSIHNNSQKYKDHQNHHQQQPSASSTKSVSIFVYKTLNTVFKNSRKLIVRVCEVASSKKPLKMFNLQANMKNRSNNRSNDKDDNNGKSTGHDRFCQTRLYNR